MVSGNLLPSSASNYAHLNRSIASELVIRHFKYFLEGRSFTMFTDHKLLVSAMSKASDLWTARQQRHLAHISEFSTDIRHISGKDNVVADCLSRNISGTNTLDNVVLGIDYTLMARAQTRHGCTGFSNSHHWPHYKTYSDPQLWTSLTMRC